MLCGYCNSISATEHGSSPAIEPPVMLCGYCNYAWAVRVDVDDRGIEPPVMLCGYCNGGIGLDMAEEQQN